MKNNKCIFIVDDDESDLWLATKIIKLNGLADRIVTAKDGDEALRKLKEYEAEYKMFPEAFLIDIKMPSIGGFELIEKIRERKLFSYFDTNIILISADFGIQDFVNINNKRIKNVLLKPLNEEQFIALLHSDPY